MPEFRTLTTEEAYQKLKHYCSYQERCHREVENKLYELKVRSADHGDVVSKLIEENYLNEERFAMQYAGGKFRLKQWGKRKIIYSLQSKGVSDYCIRKALKQIDKEEYQLTINKLVAKKMKLLSGTFAMKKKKTLEYLVGKGFEYELVVKTIGDPPKKKSR